MTPIPSLPVPAPAVTPTPTPAVDGFNSSDLDRLRDLIQATAAQTVNPAGSASLNTEAVTATRSFGDSILEGMMKFSNNYQSSMNSIETRLSDIVQKDSSSLSNFGDILALQVDVAKWSMSVMGVDNASKAGSNTIKELSRGG